jgi:hypothetical protein
MSVGRVLLLGGVAMIAACQVRGLVGSNESADASDSAETASESAASRGSGADSADSATDGGTGGEGGGSQGGSGSWGDGASTGDSGWRLDVADDTSAASCAPPSFPSCDAGEAEVRWQHAMGFCDPNTDADFARNTRPGAMEVVRGRIGGEASPFAPREGQRMVVLSTGIAADLARSPAQLKARYPFECEDPSACPSSDLGGERRTSLPKPLDWRGVDASDPEKDCGNHPSLVGEGDCSNTLQGPWETGDGAYDYAELRVKTEVPRFTDAIEFDFAFFSSEYPDFTGSDDTVLFNDMFVAWLESEAWTGNVSFDDAMQPITAQSVFMDYRSPSDSCRDCRAPELEGFAMEHHAGTRWLTTKAPVVPGETIELVFAIFDLSDPTLDSMVLLDGFDWSCSSSRPITTEG